MSLALLVGAILARQAPQTPSTQAKPGLTGFLLVSSDGGAATAARRWYRPDTTYAKLEARYPAPHYEVRRWGDHYAFVIDLETGPFGAYHDHSLLLGALTAKVGTDRILHAADLSEEEATALGNLYVGQLDPKTGERTLPSTLGVVFVPRIVATRGDESRSAIPQTKDPAQVRVDDALFDAARKERSVASPARRRLPPLPVRDSLTLTAIGQGNGLIDATRELAPVLDEIHRRLYKAETEACVRLFVKLGLESNARHVGAQSRATMSASEWHEMVHGFVWTHGADSGFIEGADLRFSTWLGLSYVVDPGSGAFDPANPGGTAPDRKPVHC